MRQIINSQFYMELCDSSKLKINQISIKYCTQSSSFSDVQHLVTFNQVYSDKSSAVKYVSISVM